MPKVVVIGAVGKSVSMDVDKFHVGGETIFAKNAHGEFGGKGFNRAVASARQNVETVFVAACGAEDASAIESLFEAEGARAILVKREGEQSDFASIITDAVGTTHVTVFQGAALKAEDVAPFADEIASAKVLVLDNEIPEDVNVAAAENITQAGGRVEVDSAGYAEEMNVHAAVQADNAANLTAGGSIGDAEQGYSDYVGVSAAAVNASASGDVAIAGGNGNDITVGDGGISAGQDVALYTGGTVVPNPNDENAITAGGNISMTVKDYGGGIVNINMQDELTVNNFRNGSKPLIAIFETKDGNRNPTINNQPNETIIFIDGRLAGGDIQTINLLGAIEAFPVQTPELKSEQGVFGNPPFLHDDLDVATPVAVGAIDYLLLDLPRMELSSDFPIEVEKQITANGLNPTTSYWFGQNPDKTKEEESEKTDAPDENGGSACSETKDGIGGNPVAMN